MSGSVTNRVLAKQKAQPCHFGLGLRPQGRSPQVVDVRLSQPGIQVAGARFTSTSLLPAGLIVASEQLLSLSRIPTCYPAGHGLTLTDVWDGSLG